MPLVTEGTQRRTPRTAIWYALLSLVLLPILLVTPSLLSERAAINVTFGKDQFLMGLARSSSPQGLTHTKSFGGGQTWILKVTKNWEYGIYWGPRLLVER